MRRSDRKKMRPKSHTSKQFVPDGEEETVRVVTRIRPMSRLEKQNRDEEIITAEAEDRVVQVKLGADQATGYRCNRVFSGNASQPDFFDKCGIKRILKSAVEGFSGTVFAFGQTGSGKTHTVFGGDDALQTAEISESDGLMPRAAHYLFDRLAQSPDLEFAVRATSLEIYNEHVTDLTVRQRQRQVLQVRWDKRVGFYVEDLTVVECTCTEDLLRVIETAMANRRVAESKLNHRSSRSHCMVTIYVDSKPKEGIEGYAKYGKLALVDLAGSERLKDNDQIAAGSQLMRETGQINKSLFVLGKVITGLAKAATMERVGGARDDPNRPVIPYRDSKLTKLLIDSLGGNSMCLMVACVSPAQGPVNESMSTLTFAMGVKKIKNKPVVLLSPMERIIKDLREEVAALKAENAALKRGGSALQPQAGLGGLGQRAPPGDGVGVWYGPDGAPLPDEDQVQLHREQAERMRMYHDEQGHGQGEPPPAYADAASSRSAPVDLSGGGGVGGVASGVSAAPHSAGADVLRRVSDTDKRGSSPQSSVSLPALSPGTPPPAYDALFTGPGPEPDSATAAPAAAQVLPAIPTATGAGAVGSGGAGAGAEKGVAEMTVEELKAKERALEQQLRVLTMGGDAGGAGAGGNSVTANSMARSLEWRQQLEGVTQQHPHQQPQQYMPPGGVAQLMSGVDGGGYGGGGQQQQSWASPASNLDAQYQHIQQMQQRQQFDIQQQQFEMQQQQYQMQQYNMTGGVGMQQYPPPGNPRRKRNGGRSRRNGGGGGRRGGRKQMQHKGLDAQSILAEHQNRNNGGMVF